jgi:hypothetical protein
MLFDSPQALIETLTVVDSDGSSRLLITRRNNRAPAGQ